MIELLLTGALPLPNNQLIQTVKEPIRIVEQIKELSLEEKIASNYYKCDESIQYIRADNAECLAKPLRTAQYTTSGQSTATQPQNQSSEGNGYSYGHCTYFAKQMRPDMPNDLGNANTWYTRYTGSKGYTPAVGAIGVAKSYTHVVYVIAVEGNTVTVREANYVGFNIVSTRTTSASEFLYLY